MNLPPLPEYLKPEKIKWWLEENTDADISAEFQKYGEACRHQALEEAEKLCRKSWHINGTATAHEFADEIRSLIK